MKTWIVTSVIVLAVLAGCNEEQRKVAVWGLTAHDADFVGRVVTQVDADLWLGPQVSFWVEPEGDDYRPEAAGVVLIRTLTQEASIEDTPDPSPIGPIIEDMEARPYAGLALLFPWKNPKGTKPLNNSRLNAIGGIEFSTDPDWKWSIVVEGMAGDGLISSEDDTGGPTADDYAGFVGFKYEF